MEILLGVEQWLSAKPVVQARLCECKEPLVKEHSQSFYATAVLRQNKDDWKSREESYFFRPSVFTCIGVPLRDGPRNREFGLIVSPDFQLSVLAELFRETASFLVIVDQLAQLRDVHKCCTIG